MKYEDLFKILYNLKLHPELIDYIDNKEIGGMYDKEKYYRILFDDEGVIHLHFAGICIEIPCDLSEYNEAKAYLEEISDKYKELCVNELMQSLEL